MSRKRGSISSFPTAYVFGGGVLLLLIGVLLALIFAPEKPPAPPTSTLHYEERPEERVEKPGRRLVEAPATDSPPEAPPIQESPVPIETVEVSEEAFVLAGICQDSRSKAPIGAARISFKRIWSDAEEASWKKRNAKAVSDQDRDALRELRQEEDRLRYRSSLNNESDGSYTIRLPYPGSYAIEAVATGYVPFLQVVENLGGAEEERFDLSLSTGATVSGRITESGGNIGAVDLQVLATQLHASNSKQNQYAFSDEEGHYAITGLLPGEYEITVSLIKSAYKTAQEMPYQRVTIVSADQSLDNIDFTVDAAGVVWGYVMTPDNTPVDRAEVVLCTSESVVSQALSAVVRKAPPLRDRSEEDGYYELLGVPLNEEWRIYATSQQQSPQLADPFLLTAREKSVRVDLYLFPGSFVYGYVVDDAGEAVPEASVMCVPALRQLTSRMENPQAYRDTRSDANGAFTIKELPAGNYQLIAAKKGYKFSAMGEPIYPDGYSDLEGVYVTLSSVGEGDHAIFGVVQEGSGAPLSGVDIEVEGFGSESMSAFSKSAISDSNGEFRIDGLEVGMYRLVAEKDGYAPRRLSRVLLDKSTTVTMSMSGVIRGRVLVKETDQAPETYSVSAQLLSDDGTTGASLNSLLNQEEAQEFSNKDGSFEIYVEAGAYQVRATSEKLTPGTAIAEVMAGEISDEVIIYLSKDGGMIQGRVVTADGRNPQGAQVMLVEADSSAEALATMAANSGEHQQSVAADGFFSFEQLAAGSYTVIVQHPNYANGSSDLIELAEGDSQTGIEIRLGSGGVLEGYVRKEGEAVSGATIVATGGSADASTATTDASGYYQIDGLSTGQYQVMLISMGGSTLIGIGGARSVLVDIEEGQSTRQDFGEGMGLRIEGQCTPRINGYVIIRPPGPSYVPLGETAELNQLIGKGASVLSGAFILEDLTPGDFQVDIFEISTGGIFSGSSGLEILRYVHTELVSITGEEEVIMMDCMIEY